MGTILQERLSIRERERKKAPRSGSRPGAASNKMGRRQSQRKPPQQPLYPPPSQDSNHDKKLQQRRKHKPNTSSTKRTAGRHSVQGASESKSHEVPPAEGGTEPGRTEPGGTEPGRTEPGGTEPGGQAVARRGSHRERKRAGSGASRHTLAFPCHRMSASSPDLLESRLLTLEAGSLGGQAEHDSDTDLSESERAPVSPSERVPPRLELRPEVMAGDDRSARRPRGQGSGEFDFPDSLPPPFNSWSLRQLAVFYNMEGRGAPRPRPAGSLERYLERLLQLEWLQIQTVQEESGTSTVSDVTHSCHRSTAAAASRLSSPKCILQCQRAFPLTFLSSLASHSATLSGCACTLCRIRYSTCSALCCRSTHSHARHSRISPVLERREPVSLPKRSYSESRVPSSDRSSACQTPNSHLRRMQASGNIRHPVPGWDPKPRDCSGAGSDVLDHRTGGARKRSGSEQRRSGAERPNRAEKKRSGSECSRRGTERRRTAEFREIKPDAVTAILDNLPVSKYSPVNRSNRQKQVEFVA